MALHQYIGARYVIKVYENSQDPLSNNWEANVAYEPLTLVSYNFSSYLSKKGVPDNIGNPVDNPSFWTRTGYYNGQIIDLQNRLDVDEFELGLLTDKKYITIGDSYNTTDTTSAGDNVSPWGPNLANKLGLTAGVNWWNSGYSGAGFVKEFGAHAFLDQLKDIEQTLTLDQKKEITDIIVGGGTNDGLYINDLWNYIPDFADYVKTNFPNATIRLFYLSWNAPRSASGTLDDIRTVYASMSRLDNVVSYPNGFTALLYKGNFCLDYGHPNSGGASDIAKLMKNEIAGGPNPVAYRISTGFATLGGSVTGTAVEIQSGDNVTLELTINKFDDSVNPITLIGGQEYNISITGNTLNFVIPPDKTIIASSVGYVIDTTDNVYPLHWEIISKGTSLVFMPKVFTNNAYFNGQVKYIFFGQKVIETFSGVSI